MITNLNDSILKNVSRETIERLKRYNELLIMWQEKMNLVSKASLSDAWVRHFLDSAQLYKFINDKKAKKVCDFGSGAGFPALVLAVIAKEKAPDISFSLIESIHKKANFLSAVADELGLNVKIINDRIERISEEKADIITARALSSLNNLMQYSEKFLQQNTTCLFLKGKTYKEEVDQALKNWEFDCKIHKNAVSEEGVILEIKNIRRKRCQR